MTTTTNDFFQSTDIQGALTPEQAAQLMELAATGDTGTTPDTGDAPTITTEPTTTAESDDSGATSEAKSVVLARDGIHTIPYEQYADARTNAQHWKAQAEAAQQELQRLQAQAQARAAAGQVPTPADNLAAAADAAIEAGADANLFGDFSEEAMAEGIKKLVQQQVKAHVSQATAPLREQQAQAEVQAHYGAILASHPDASSIVESAEMDVWVKSRPSYEQGALRAVLEGGTTAQVIELLDAFKGATGKGQAASAGQDHRQAAKAAISAATAPPPVSLSDIPGGRAGSTSVHEQMASMDSASMVDAMLSMTQEQRENFLNRRA